MGCGRARTTFFEKLEGTPCFISPDPLPYSLGWPEEVVTLYGQRRTRMCSQIYV